MKKITLPFLAIFALFSAFTISCKDDITKKTSNGKLEDNIRGSWDLVSVQYSGESPSPWDSTVVLPLQGQGELVDGGFNFTHTDSVNYQLAFLAQIEFGSGLNFSGNVDEKGRGIYSVPHPDTLHVERNDGEIHDWYVLTNTQTKQVWVTRYRMKPDGTPYYVEVDMKIQLEK